MNEETEFTIVSAPVAISFICPHCKMEQRIRWKELDVPKCWSDDWDEVDCPECGKPVKLGTWNYD